MALSDFDFATTCAKASLLSFACLLWDGYTPAAHHRLIAKKLEGVLSGEIQRLMIFMPPRHGKSMLCSEFFLAWYLGLRPEHQVIFATYSQDLADDYGRRVRNWIKDPRYRAVFPNTRLAPDSASCQRFGVGERGAYFAVGVGGSVVGRGANLLVIDDPLKGREEADSSAMRRRLKDWYSSVAYTRLMGKGGTGAIIVILTRWHPDDLGGWLLKEHTHENWEVLSLPAVSSQDKALWPERFPVEALKRIQLSLSSRDWMALYQQQPVVEGGNILKTNWWQPWRRAIPPCSYVIQSWDTAFSDRDLKQAAYSARTTWGVFADEKNRRSILLLDAWRGRVDYPTLKQEALASYKLYQPDCVLIEKKATGQSLIQDMRRSGFPVVAYQPDRDKVARAYAVQAVLESGLVYFPERAWAQGVIAECAQFPNGEQDDWVDTCTQAWLRLRNSGQLSLEAIVPKRVFDDEQEDHQRPIRQQHSRSISRDQYASPYG